eukprot:8726423-Pyramimonas_sp.AAC.1
MLSSRRPLKTSSAARWRRNTLAGLKGYDNNTGSKFFLKVFTFQGRGWIRDGTPSHRWMMRPWRKFCGNPTEGLALA